MRGSWAGVSVTPDSALSVPAVWRGLMLTAGFVSMLPVDQFKSVPGDRQIELDPGPLLASPSAVVEAMDWRFQVLESAIMHGGAYGIVVQRDRLGYPTQVELVHPSNVQARYRQSDRQLEWRIYGQVTSADDVWHMAGRPKLGSPFGLSLHDYMLDSVAVGVAGRKYGAEWFSAGGAPTAVVRPRVDPGPDGAVALKAKIRQMLQSREPAVIPQDVVIDQWGGSSPQDAALVDLLKHNSTDLALFFGIPAEMVGGSTGDAKTYKTAEHQVIELLVLCNQYWITKLDRKLTAGVPRGQFVKVNETAALRTDIKTRLDVLVTEVRAGLRSQNEGRNKLNLPPVDGGDRLVWPPFASAVSAAAAKDIETTPAPGVEE